VADFLQAAFFDSEVIQNALFRPEYDIFTIAKATFVYVFVPDFFWIGHYLLTISAEK